MDKEISDRQEINFEHQIALAIHYCCPHLLVRAFAYRTQGKEDEGTGGETEIVLIETREVIARYAPGVAAPRSSTPPRVASL